MWEKDRYDWANLRSSESAIGIPDAILGLQRATTEDEADRAYWKIDNEVIVQGALYEAALPTIRCLLSALLDCTDTARPKIIELLFQLGNGEPDSSEIALGNIDLDSLCRREVWRGTPLFFDAIEKANPDWLDLCVDILIICADEDSSLKPRIAWYLRRVLSQDIYEGIRELIMNWLKEQSE
jgi:hypothetical protein